MDFSAKLAQLRVPGGRAAPRPAVASERGSRLSELLPASDTLDGPLHVRTARHEARVPCVASLASLALDDSLAGVDPQRLLFLDTETTGLAGGAGTVPFLIGLAFFEGGALVVEQLHLSAPGLERPVLQRLRERLERASGLVTFNGKSFDWPLVKARLVMNRLPAPPPLPHVDLLHCARRVFRFELDSVRLGTLEGHALGVLRTGDIDGADIPQAWFDFLRTGRVATLARVLEHNAQDVLSMAALAELLGQAWRGERALGPKAALGLGTVAFRTEAFSKALSFALAAQAAERGAVRGLALELEALARRKLGDVAGAVRALEAALPVHGAVARVHLALAKLYEHKVKEPERALRHARLGASAEDAPTAWRRERRLVKVVEHRRGEIFQLGGW